MIWAISPFNNELDVLEIKLGTIGHLVDRFVLAESTVTQRGQPKPLHLEEFLHAKSMRFAPWLEKIEYVVVDDMPGGSGTEADWVRERHQRNALVRGMGDLVSGDVVLISDLDEIPYPEALEEAIAAPPMRLIMDLFVYRLNWRWCGPDRAPSIGTLACTIPGNRLPPFTAQTVCDALFQLFPVAGVPQVSGPAGWHLTYQGDVATIRQKMVGMADNFYEQLVPEEKRGDPNEFLTDAWIEQSIATGRDVYGRDYRPSEWVGLKELPPYVQEHRERFAHMLVPKP